MDQTFNRFFSFPLLFLSVFFRVHLNCLHSRRHFHSRITHIVVHNHSNQHKTHVVDFLQPNPTRPSIPSHFLEVECGQSRTKEDTALVHLFQGCLRSGFPPFFEVRHEFEQQSEESEKEAEADEMFKQVQHAIILLTNDGIQLFLCRHDSDLNFRNPGTPVPVHQILVPGAECRGSSRRRFPAQSHSEGSYLRELFFLRNASAQLHSVHGDDPGSFRGDPSPQHFLDFAGTSPEQQGAFGEL